MNRTTRPRTPARNRPEVEPLESRALLSLAGVSVPFTGTGVNSTPLIPPISGDNYGASPALTVLDPDGTIVQATSFNADGGEGAGSYSVVKLNADGSLDTAFGQNGRVTVQVGNSPGVATSLVVRPDGTIDVGGRFDNSIDVTSAASVGVIQITPTGALDTSFGNQGFATLPALDPDQQSFSGLGGMTLTASGQLIVVGQGITQNGTSTAFYAARLNQNGSLDSTFGTGGVAMVPVTLNGITINQGTAVAVQPSGRIIVAGKAATAVLPNGIFTLDLSDSVVFGLTSNGTLDTSFGGPSANGEVILAPVATSDSTQGIRQVAAMTLSSSGQIVLAETDTSYSSAYGTGQAIGDLTRLNADGTIDTTFGAAGTATFTNGLTPLGVTVQANGQILVPGEANVNEQSVARYNADGSPDVNFGTIATPGLISFPTSYFRDGGPFSTAAIDANGRIVLGGTYDSGGSGMQNGTAYFSIARSPRHPPRRSTCPRPTTTARDRPIWRSTLPPPASSPTGPVMAAPMSSFPSGSRGWARPSPLRAITPGRDRPRSPPTCRRRASTPTDRPPVDPTSSSRSGSPVPASRSPLRATTSAPASMTSPSTCPPSAPSASGPPPADPT
jgi:uncharacterized delta-60 repeat protein